MPRARKKLVHRAKTKRARSAALTTALDIAFDMEEPLRQATWFVRALEQVGGQGDPEIEALSFVATEARVRLETAEDLWIKLCDAVRVA
jgi:hypothetical protein